MSPERKQSKQGGTDDLILYEDPKFPFTFQIKSLEIGFDVPSILAFSRVRNTRFLIWDKISRKINKISLMLRLKRKVDNQISKISPACFYYFVNFPFFGFISSYV